jgi:hypothetical protein
MSSSPVVLSLGYTLHSTPSPFSLLPTSPTNSSFSSQRQSRATASKEISIKTSRPMNAGTYAKLWLQDDPLQNGNLFREGDRERIATCTYSARSILTIWLTSFAGMCASCGVACGCSWIFPQHLGRSGPFALERQPEAPNFLSSRQHQNRPPLSTTSSRYQLPPSHSNVSYCMCPGRLSSRCRPTSYSHPRSSSTASR